MPIISTLRLIHQEPQSTNSTKLFISTPSHSKTEFEPDGQLVSAMTLTTAQIVKINF